MREPALTETLQIAIVVRDPDVITEIFSGTPACEQKPDAT